MTESFGLSYKWESRRTVESRIANALEENLSLELRELRRQSLKLNKTKGYEGHYII